MMLIVHLSAARGDEIRDEIWQQSLSDAINADADTIAEHAALEPATSPHHTQMRTSAFRFAFLSLGFASETAAATYRRIRI